MIYVVCGVPASGKSWVCEQLKGSFKYVKHDSYKDKAAYADALVEADQAPKPVIGDCPFAERVLKELLDDRGANVEFVFIIESPETIQSRYSERNKEIPKTHLSRLNTIKDRAEEWESFSGTSKEVCDYLKAKPISFSNE